MDTSTSKMGVGGLLKKLLPFVLPYRWLLILTLVLTFVGSLMAQVNAVVLDRAVDAINALLHVEGGFEWGEAARLLLTVSAVLLGKEVLAAVITFGQRIFGEKIRINVSRDLSLRVVDRILQFRMAFFSNEGNEPGKLQTRIDRGVMSLSNTVKNFFIDILPLFTSAVMALVLMFAANVYVGLVALAIIPIYFFITARQGVRMKGWRRRVFGTHQALNHGIMNIIESMGVIKSFNRERLEADRQAKLQNDSTDQQMATRRISFLFEGLKTFVEQIGTVLIIILTAYLVLIDYPGMTIGKIMYHVLLFSNVSAPIRQLHRIYDDLNDALIYAEGFFGILEADGEVEPTGSHRPPMVRGAFELKNVEFTYSNGTHAIRDLSMTMRQYHAGRRAAEGMGHAGAARQHRAGVAKEPYLQRHHRGEYPLWQPVGHTRRGGAGGTAGVYLRPDCGVAWRVRGQCPAAERRPAAKDCHRSHVPEESAYHLPRRAYSQPRRYRYGTDKVLYRCHKAGPYGHCHQPQYRADYRLRRIVCAGQGARRAARHTDRGVPARRIVQGDFRCLCPKHERGQNRGYREFERVNVLMRKSNKRINTFRGRHSINELTH